MAQLITLKLDKLPPSVNGIWRAVAGRVIKSADYRKWMEATAWDFAEQAKGQKLIGPYAMHISAVKPDRRRRDITNTIKAVEDAIVRAGLVHDDSDCQRVKAEWRQDGPAMSIWLIATGASDD